MRTNLTDRFYMDTEDGEVYLDTQDGTDKPLMPVTIHLKLSRAEWSRLRDTHVKAIPTVIDITEAIQSLEFCLPFHKNTIGYGPIKAAIKELEEYLCL